MFFSLLSRFFILISIALFLPTNWAAASAMSGKLNAYIKYNQSISSSDKSTEQVSLAIHEKYQVLFSNSLKPSKLKNLSTIDLGHLLSATNEDVFYTKDPQRANDMALIVRYLQERNKATNQHYEKLYKAYILVRMLNEALDLRLRHPTPEMEALPELLESTNLTKNVPTEWQVDLTQNKLERRSVDIASGPHVIIVSHPNCHFSQNAMRDIMADPILKHALATHSKLLMPQSYDLNFNSVQLWNQTHPEFPMSITYFRKEWPSIDYWGTPSFYFFKDGALQTTVIGWPREGNKEKLLEALQQIGLFKNIEE